MKCYVFFNIDEILMYNLIFKLYCIHLADLPLVLLLPVALIGLFLAVAGGAYDFPLSLPADFVSLDEVAVFTLS